MKRFIKSMEEKYFLIPGGLDGIHGQVSYADYPSLR